MLAIKQLALLALATIVLTCSPGAMASQLDAAPRRLRSEPIRLLNSLDVHAASTHDSAGITDSTEIESRGQITDLVKEKVKEKATAAKDKTKEKAIAAKDKATEKAAAAKEKVKEKATALKDKTAEKAAAAKEKATAVKDNAKEKATALKDKTKEKATEVKDKVKDKIKDKINGVPSPDTTVSDTTEDGAEAARRQ